MNMPAVGLSAKELDFWGDADVIKALFWAQKYQNTSRQNQSNETRVLTNEYALLLQNLDRGEFGEKKILKCDVRFWVILGCLDDSDNVIKK